MKTELKLEELAEAAATSARTVRYYVQRGLLPPPVFRGKDSTYGEAHVVRLRAIQKLQAAFFPLDAIKSVLDESSGAEIERIADGAVPSVKTAHVPASPRAPQSPHVPQHVKERWEKIVLMPGVELLIAESAGAHAKKFAEHVVKVSQRAEKEIK